MTDIIRKEQINMNNEIRNLDKDIARLNIDINRLHTSCNDQKYVSTQISKKNDLINEKNSRKKYCENRLRGIENETNHEEIIEEYRRQTEYALRQCHNTEKLKILREQAEKEEDECRLQFSKKRESELTKVDNKFKYTVQNEEDRILNTIAPQWITRELQEMPNNISYRYNDITYDGYLDEDVEEDFIVKEVFKNISDFFLHIRKRHDYSIYEIYNTDGILVNKEQYKTQKINLIEKSKRENQRN